jgi:hypothetical protein
MRSISSIRILRLTLALAVALWMAGAGCMLGCENMVSAEAANGTGSPAGFLNDDASPANTETAFDSSVITAGNSCPSMHSHDCCAKRATHASAKPAAKVAAKPVIRSATHLMTSALVAELSGTSSMMMDCPLAVNASAALSKARPDLSSVSLTPARVTDSLPNKLEQTAALSSSPLRLPNRGHTYLRCCVFLI